MDIELNTVTVKLDPPSDGPVPLRIKRDTKNPNCWATPKGIVVATKEMAEKKIYFDSEQYRSDLHKRIHASRLVNAEIVEDWDGWVTVDGDGDDYFDSVGALIERYEGDEYEPSYCFCTTESGFEFDLEGYLESYMADNHHEDASDLLENVDELLQFFQKWSDKQSITTYWMDSKRIVVIDPERFEIERRAAKEWLEAHT